MVGVFDVEFVSDDYLRRGRDLDAMEFVVVTKLPFTITPSGNPAT